MSLRTRVVAVGLSAAAALAAPPGAHAGTCKQWDVSGHWDIEQSGKGIVDVKFDLTQTGWQIEGTAYFCERCGQSGFLDPFAATFEGPVKGSLVGRTLELTIDWGYERVGRYTATIGPEGQIQQGHTHDLKHSDSTGTWGSSRTAECLSDRPPAAEAPIARPRPQPSARPVHQLGKKKVGVTAVQDTPLYDAPNAGLGPIGTLTKGMEAVVIGQQGTWYKLKINSGGSGVGSEAWAEGATLSFRYIQ